MSARGINASTEARVTFVGHATALIEQHGVRVLTDPLLRRRVGPLVRVAKPVDSIPVAPDLVVISHLHRDHFDVPSLRALGVGTKLIVPRGAGGFARKLGFRAVSELAAGDSEQLAGLTVSAVPARHDGRRSPFGARAECIGYVISGSVRIYFAGDTSLIDDMADLAPGLDLALLPVSGWGLTLGRGHLGPSEAAAALPMLKPRIAIPIHWGTVSPVGMADSGDAPAREFAARVAELAPGVRVVQLAPGESCDI